jgi:hypothetical protein
MAFLGFSKNGRASIKLFRLGMKACRNPAPQAISTLA